MFNVELGLCGPHELRVNACLPVPQIRAAIVIVVQVIVRVIVRVGAWTWVVAATTTGHDPRMTLGALATATGTEITARAVRRTRRR